MVAYIARRLFASVVLELVGMGICLSIPQPRRTNFRTLAIVAFACVCGGVVLAVPGVGTGRVARSGCASSSTRRGADGASEARDDHCPVPDHGERPACHRA